MALTTPDQSIWTPVDTGGVLAEAPADSVADGIFIYSSVESSTGFVRRVIDGTYRASWAGIFPSGAAATNATRLNAVLANASVKEVVFNTPEGGDIPLSGTISVSNKVLSISSGAAFTGTYTLSSPNINAAYNQVIFKGTPTITTPQSVSGKFSVNWWGVIADGSTDVSANLLRCATAVNTSFQKNIIFPGYQSRYVINTSTTIPSGVILSFDNGAILTGTGILTGGIIDAGYRQQIFDSSFLPTPSGYKNAWASVMWFGAAGTGSGNDQPACQACVDMAFRMSPYLTVVYFPGGAYRMTSSLKVMNFNSGSSRYEQVCVLLKGEGEGYASKFPSRGTRLIFTDKNTPGIAFQIGKSGGVQSICIEGPYVPPSMSAADFYNSDISTYGDPTCRDQPYSPLCAIAVDAVKYGGVPVDGGYPGFNYNAPGNVSSSGSSGLIFDDIRIIGFTIGVIFSPNGQTQNDDAMTTSNCKVDNVKIAFQCCQDQEKGNKFKNIVCWGVCHTVFSNSGYGAGTSGHIDIDGVNVAGLNAQFINWYVSGRFSPSMRAVYSETLGKFGTLTTTACAVSITDSIWRWASPPERGNYFSNWHINISNGVTFERCSFMTYGNFFPTIIANNGPNSSGGAFNNCYFDNFPCEWVEQNQGSAIFTNCYSNAGGRFGINANTTAANSEVKKWLTYGNYTINDIATGPSSNANGKKYIIVNGNYVYNRVLTGSSISVTVNSDRTATVTLTPEMVWYHRVNFPVYFGSAFAGLVSSVDTVAGTLTIKFLNKDIVSGTYNITALCPATFYGFMGNSTNGSNQLTGCRADNDLGVVVGEIIFHPIFGSIASSVVTGISGSLTSSPGATITMNSNASRTTTGVYFGSAGVSKAFVNPSFNQLTNSWAAATIFPASSIVTNAPYGIPQTIVTTKTGFLNAASASDTRQAEFSITSLPTIIDRFVPGDVGKPTNGSTTYQNDMLRAANLTDFSILFGGVELYPGLSTQLSYTLNNGTGTITITNGAFDSNVPVVIKGR